MREFNRQEDSLWKAAFDGKADKVKLLLRKFEESKNRCLFQDVLTCAVQNGHASVVKVLLAAGADPEQTDGSSTVLMNAAWGGHLDVVQALVAGGAKADRRFKGRTALEAALENSHREVADYLKRRDAESAQPTLMQACRQGDLVGVKRAIADGASINRRSGPLKETALMQAAAGGSLQVVEHLLQQGASATTRSKGKTALWDAALGGNVAVIDALLEAGANPADDNDGCTVLMAAAQFGGLPAVKRLVQLGADVNALDGTGAATALDYARKGRNAAVVSFLRSHGGTSARDRAHELARAVTREFGGRARAVHDGFSIRSKPSGFQCWFRIGLSSGSVSASNLDFVDEILSDTENAELVIGRKPDRRRGRFQQVQMAAKSLGVPVFRWAVRGGIAADSAKRLCQRHRSSIRQLGLSGREELCLATRSVEFRWVESDSRRLLDKLRAFLFFVRSVARQGRPDASESWTGD